MNSKLINGFFCVVALASSAISIPAFAAGTVVEITNDSSSDETLINTNYSGTVSPSAPNPLLANDSVTLVSTTPGTVDAGVITYESCRFNWSVILVGSIYQFSDGAEPSSDCSSQVVYQNFYTGEYSVEFTVD